MWESEEKFEAIKKAIIDRDVMFRVWDTNKKEMIYDYCEWYDKDNIGKRITENEKIFPAGNNHNAIKVSYLEDLGQYNFEGEEIISSYVMEFTGLWSQVKPEDSRWTWRGKAIYEGDIIKSTKPALKKEGNLVVLFIEGAFCYQTKAGRYRRLTKSLCSSCKIVGNVFENSELIE